MTIVDKILSMPVPVLNHWGYWIIFVSAAAETFPFFGLFIPGQTIVILGGFFAKIGALKVGGVMLVSAVGSIVGDIIGYVLGRKYGHSFISKYGKYFFFKKDRYEKTMELMREHTGKTLLIGRFHSLTRAFVPFVAGMTKVRFSKFLFYIIVGGISWAASFVLIGFFFGKSYEIASKYMNGIILAVIAVTVLLIYIFGLRKKIKKM